MLKRVFGMLSIIFVLIIAALIFNSDPPRSATNLIVPDPEKYDSDALLGRVLPFRVISAIRNFGFSKENRIAQISVSVEGGTPADWMATGIYIAEHSIVNGAKRSDVEVLIPNPWGDWPPLHAKYLARVGVDPAQAGTNSWVWFIQAADRAGTIADVDFDIVANEQIDRYSGQISNPDRLGAKADSEARKIIIKRYGLPHDWQPRDLDLGLVGKVYDRAHIHIINTDGIEPSMAELMACLMSDKGSIFKGCELSESPYIRP